MSAVVTPTTTQIAQTLPPIAQIIPFISKTSAFLVATASYLIHALLVFASWVSYPMHIVATAPLPAILYIVSPISTFGQILFSVFFLIPYNATVDIFVALQPVYVFCGVACITGAVIALGGRLFAVVVSTAIMGPAEVNGGPSTRTSFDKPKKRTVP